MNPKTIDDEAIRERVREMVRNETRYGIFMAIQTYGSLNIKTLAEILGKTESTIFHHLAEMLEEPKILEIDNEKTEKNRGKFYKLTERLAQIYKESEEKAFESEVPDLLGKLHDVSDEELIEFLLNNLKKQPDLGNVAQAARRSLAYEHIIENFVLSNFEKAEKALLNDLVPVRKDFPIGGFSNLSIDIRIFKARHMLLISNAISDFLRELTKLKKQIQEEIKKEHVDSERIVTEHLHIFSGELGDFQFVKKE